MRSPPASASLYSSAVSEEEPQSLSATSMFTPADPKYDALMEWLRGMGATLNSKLQIRPSTRGGGFGAFVTEAVQPQEVLFTIPRAACVTLSNALQDPNCGSAFQQLIDKAGPGANTVVLAGFLAQERLLNALYDADQDRSAEDSSAFGPYLATLPWERGVNNQEHMLFWSDADVDRYLAGTMCYSEALSLRDEVALATKVLQGVVGRSIRLYQDKSDGPGGFKWPWQTPTEADTQQQALFAKAFAKAMTGAFVCLLTRAFQDGEGDDEKLVPLLDLLQHSDTPNVSHEMMKHDGTVVVTARQTIPANDELLNQYRPELEETMPYHRFFTRFGFVPGIQEPIQNLLDDKSSIFYAQKAEV